MTDIQITKTTIGDLAQLQQIGKQTFSETFASSNTEENMKKYLEEGFSLQKLSADLQNPNYEFYFATLNQAVIGYLKLNFGQAQTELKDDKALEIERIYVLQEFQGKKIGQLLYNQAVQIAKNKNVAFIWLGVWEKNHRAIQFYTKNGFVEFDQHIFVLGNDKQTDIMMRLKIKG